jgi:hypothetical protein
MLTPSLRKCKNFPFNPIKQRDSKIKIRFAMKLRAKYTQEMFVIKFRIFYFLLIIPNKKVEMLIPRIKEDEQMQLYGMTLRGVFCLCMKTVCCLCI